MPPPPPRSEPRSVLKDWRREVLRLAPCLASEAPLSWPGRSCSWQTWCRLRLGGQLASALADAREDAARHELDRLLARAGSRAKDWCEAERHASLAAGRDLLGCSHGARGHEAYLALRDRWLDSGEPTWYHAVLASRAAFLHQPLTHLLVAYAWREWRVHQDRLVNGRESGSLERFDLLAGPTVAAVVRDSFATVAFGRALSSPPDRVVGDLAHD